MQIKNSVYCAVQTLRFRMFECLVKMYALLLRRANITDKFMRERKLKTVFIVPCKYYASLPSQKIASTITFANYANNSRDCRFSTHRNIINRAFQHPLSYS